jgi:SAM-dependent methyltransferase
MSLPDPPSDWSERGGWQRRYLERFYPRGAGWIDGTTEFHGFCASAIGGGRKILEVGAGPTNRTSRFLSGLGELHGVDLSPEVHGNIYLRSATVLESERYPFPDASFDAAVSDYVVEHVANPRAHLAEVRRVLRPGGAYIFRTPNRFHYVPAVAAITPHWFHEMVANRLRQNPKGAHEPYPTFYRLNSRGAVRRLSAGAGLELADIRMVEKEPSYGMASRLAFLVFTAYERLVNAHDSLSFLRANLFVVLRRPHTPP